MRVLFRLARWLIALGLGIPLVMLALRERMKRSAESKPRLVYGPTPILNLKYMAQAMQQRGYVAQTVVSDVYSINSRDDFDVLYADILRLDWLPKGLRRVVERVLAPYAAFLWALPRFDVFHFYFHGGFLQGTPWQYLEIPLLQWAGKKVICFPYGSDSAIQSRIKSVLFKQGLIIGYPHLIKNEKAIARMVDYLAFKADFVVACIFHYEPLPRWDLLTTLYYPIDLGKWQPPAQPSLADGTNGEVVVFHSPNHRSMKGSEQLIKAVQELQLEGLKVRLDLVEKRPNSEVRQRLAAADILADQFLVGYALSAIEGMALSKPVMSNIVDPYYYQINRVYTGLDECPIVATDIEEIKEKLRMLVTQPQLRQELGEQGRRYVEKYHSYESVGRMWELVYRKVWWGENIELSFWHPDRVKA